MTASIVFTFIGSDKPGLIETLSNTVSTYEGNWLESRMSQLAGLFAGIARVQVPDYAVTDLINALEQLNISESTTNLQIVVQTTHSDQTNNTNYTQYEFTLIGNDRPNIVKEITSALTIHSINVCEMHTDVISAPMTAESLFTATADIQVPSSLDIIQLREELDNIAEELGVDINLEN